MRKLAGRLLDLRLGSGAVVLPKDVQRIHLRFAPRIEGGHMGPRKFWRQELRRLKYHNPGVAMTVDRTAVNGQDDAMLSIHWDEEKVDTIRMTGLNNKEIMGEVMKRVPSAFEVEATEEDKAEMRNIEQLAADAERVRAKSSAHKALLKREKELSV
ncbi:hypothetical protein K470DRAFT_259919 [Piedraia hortae CBS 480.64]|uniref:Ribosomal protein/NADH dehydrogenase domain-containing protein n=1 Tax=Piedraia hortae CBS 480.64 TaxID=1314780 RepID=A0A6A7BV12_9PEZI|nr:hypothetical protein K470DRAFT_259919 [Piedraia hortae CBS 480.64]